MWHGSCCKPYKPGIDQCNGEAALQLVGPDFNKAQSQTSFYSAYKALNRMAITSDRKNDGATGEHNESPTHRN
jgi:hypothetical protein